MKLENQVVSLNLAKRLKELGVKQESLFYHWATEIEQDGLAWWNVSEKEPRKGKPVRAYLDSVGRPSVLSAFTVAELGEMLPKNVYTVKDDEGFYCWSDTEWTNEEGLFDDHLDPIHADTEADARAKCLTYLLENKLIAGV